MDVDAFLALPDVDRMLEGWGNNDRMALATLVLHGAHSDDVHEAMVILRYLADAHGIEIPEEE